MSHIVHIEKLPLSSISLMPISSHSYRVRGHLAMGCLQFRLRTLGLDLGTMRLGAEYQCLMCLMFVVQNSGDGARG